MTFTPSLNLVRGRYTLPCLWALFIFFNIRVTSTEGVRDPIIAYRKTSPTFFFFDLVTLSMSQNGGAQGKRLNFVVSRKALEANFETNL